jgi:hypothetical protein
MNIPPFNNNPDNSSCFQAALKSSLESLLLPPKKLNWEKLYQMTGKSPGKYTWPYTTIHSLLTLGLEVVYKSKFNHHLFITQPEKAIYDFYGIEAGNIQILNTNVMKESSAAQSVKQFLMQQETSIPTYEELLLKIKEGYHLIIELNSRVLRNKEGYSGHCVLVYDGDASGLTMHDSGSSGSEFPNLFVPRELFEKAWAYPSEKNRNYLAIRKR